MKIIILLVISFLITGCWNYRELDEIAIITGIAIDKEENDFIVTVIVASGNDDDNEINSVTYSGRGKSIYEAFNNNKNTITKIAVKNVQLENANVADGETNLNVGFGPGGMARADKNFPNQATHRSHLFKGMGKGYNPELVKESQEFHKDEVRDIHG